MLLRRCAALWPTLPPANPSARCTLHAALLAPQLAAAAPLPCSTLLLLRFATNFCPHCPIPLLSPAPTAGSRSDPALLDPATHAYGRWAAEVVLGLGLLRGTWPPVHVGVSLGALVLLDLVRGRCRHSVVEGRSRQRVRMQKRGVPIGCRMLAPTGSRPRGSAAPQAVACWLQALAAGMHGEASPPLCPLHRLW